MILALDKCQKSLTNYLNSKRAVFPRFTFLSDDDLLSILGSGEPTAIQEHVGKMFDNLDKFRFEINNTERVIATGLISCEKEVMDFRNVVLAEGKIEEWMVLALEEMKRSNRFLTKKAIYDYGKVSLLQRIYYRKLGIFILVPSLLQALEIRRVVEISLYRKYFPLLA